MPRLGRRLACAAPVILAAIACASASDAQTFTFRLEPSCTKVTLTLVPSGSPSVLGVVGYDDNCGHLPRAPIHGTAVVNPGGGFTIGYTTILPFSVYQRSDVGLQTSVEFPPNSRTGQWTDDDGNSGTFVFDVLDQPSG